MERKTFNLRLTPKLRDKLESYSDFTERNMTEICLEAIREYFERKGL